VCQLHMRHTRMRHDTRRAMAGEAFPLLKDLVVAGVRSTASSPRVGFISTRTDQRRTATPCMVPRTQRTWHGRGRLPRLWGVRSGLSECVRVLFVAAKVSHLAFLPQGAPERERRAEAMVRVMDRAGFGNCTNHFECMAACPKGISVENIARLTASTSVRSGSSATRRRTVRLSRRERSRPGA